MTVREYPDGIRSGWRPFGLFTCFFLVLITPVLYREQSDLFGAAIISEAEILRFKTSDGPALLVFRDDVDLYQTNCLLNTNAGLLDVRLLDGSLRGRSLGINGAGLKKQARSADRRQ